MSPEVHGKKCALITGGTGQDSYAHQILGAYRHPYGLHLSCGIMFSHESLRRPLNFAAAALGLTETRELDERGQAHSLGRKALCGRHQRPEQFWLRRRISSKPCTWSSKMRPHPTCHRHRTSQSMNSARRHSGAPGSIGPDLLSSTRVWYETSIAIIPAPTLQSFGPSLGSIQKSLFLNRLHGGGKNPGFKLVLQPTVGIVRDSVARQMKD
jgi:hypothetical protein